MLDYKPKIQTEYLSSEVKEKFDLGDKKESEKAGQKRDAEENENDETSNDQPPQKKAKLKGRNKQRPGKQRINQKDRLCPAIKEDRECKFGENCKFNHNIENFMANKPPDLDGMCYVFEKFGFCKFGLTCRFAKCHITDDFKNVVNQELFEKTKGGKEINIIDTDVRHKLWKKKYDFTKSDSLVKSIQQEFKDSWNKTTESEKKSETNASHLDQDKGEVKCETSIKSSDSSQDKGEQVKCETAVSETSIKSSDSSGPRTLGQITDEEIFPLKRNEKVKVCVFLLICVFIFMQF